MKLISRMRHSKYVESLVSEAARVGYVVTGQVDDFYQVFDEGNLVFAALQVVGTKWIVSYSSLYWEEQL